MESNIKGLVAAGHEMASELKAECGAVDMRSVAKLISDLATQLEVQLVRANALAAENARLKAAHPQPFGHEMMKALDAYEKYQDEVPETGMLNAFFILRDSIRVDTPATDAFLAEVRAQGVEMYADNLDNGADDAERGGFDYAVKFLRSEASGVRLFADQLRKGGNQ
ncbi:TPA: hypothetical protein RY462_000366 [Escherichia albertii]|uniref:hypothetical protein n=1 Tax=Escherichia albertii TaxID=208962 RepID=UPI00290B3B81|nr:hypothetical protein [Escherichia albertii]WOA27857.1 hypothetical protein RXE34_06225 [Escherichia albertii]HEB1148354.1 hypothetical protein [Escherichia albertii]HEB1186654.1 hypothetical protein [Escherichia albertii]HEB1581272.1 hypothetical protein [Escherichia albertii]HEB1600403.1 hypothetical protein [Escherichia albertii]